MKFFNGIIVLFLCVISFTSCDLFDTRSDYNQGYKEGYLAGLRDGAKQSANTAKNEERTVDPNLKITEKDKPVTVVNNVSIPAKAYQVLSFIREKNKAPDGYIGGRQFGNYEHRLPERDEAGNGITYREWDINQKEEGQNRGTQRLVTGSDGRAWYTDDHYNSFTEMKSR